MSTSKTKALVLKKTKLGETDLIITLLDETGLQRRAVAKGARKPGSFMAARLELYMLVEVQLSSGRTLEIVTDARVQEAHVGCRRDIEHSAAAAVLVELIEKATAHHNVEPLLFAMAEEALTQIGQAEGAAPYCIALACVLKVCAALGVRPDAEEVASLNPATARWVDTLINARFVELHALTGDEYLPVLRDLSHFTTRWLAEHLDIKLKSLAFLVALL